MSARKGLQEVHLQMLIETGAAREFLVQRTEATRTWNLQTLALYLEALGARAFGVEQ